MVPSQSMLISIYIIKKIQKRHQHEDEGNFEVNRIGKLGIKKNTGALRIDMLLELLKLDHYIFIF